MNRSPSTIELDAAEVDDAAVDAAVAAIATPVPQQGAVLDTFGELGQALTSTPRRAALVTLWAVGVVLAVVSAIKTSVTVHTSLGPATAHCGLDVFVYGYPDAAIAHACRHTEASRAAVFVPAALVVVAGLVAVAIIAIGLTRRHDGRVGRALGMLGRAPVDAGLIVLGALGLVGGVLALRPAAVQITAAGSLTTAHCGIDTYLFGYPDPTIEHACTRAFTGQAHVLVGVTVLAAVGLLALLHLLRRNGIRRLSRQIACLGVGVALAVVVLAALRPVTVSIMDNGTSVTASCGLDSYVAGYPDHAVQHACRSHDATHAAAVLGAMALAAVGMGAMVLTKEGERD